MLKRAYRVSKKEFDIVIETGKAVHSDFFWLRYVKSQEIATKIAVIAPKKIAKTAVLRNKIRRKVYEAIRPIYDSVKPGYIVIVSAKDLLVKNPNTNISIEVKKIFEKAKILA